MVDTQPSLLSSPSFQTRESQEIHSVQRMIYLLRNYENNCLRNGNFFEAEASKIRILHLKDQQLKHEHEELSNKNKENIQEVDRRNQKEVSVFNEVWEDKIKQLLEGYKQLQERMKKDHDLETTEFQAKLDLEEPPKIKFSSSVLKMRTHLDNLIKCRSYLEADYISQQLVALEQQETGAWALKFEDRKNKQYQQLVKKQEVEMQALKLKIKTMFNERIKEKEDAYNKLLNRIQRRRVQSGKCPVELKIKEKQLRKTGHEASRSTSKHKIPLGDKPCRYSFIKE